MKTPFKNIYDVLKLNRFIVLIVVVVATLTSIVSILMVIKLHKEAVNNAFVVNGDGSVIPLQLVSQRENLKVEALAHLELFHRYFYNLDASNYESNLEKALWLGNSSADALYRQKKADGFYNRLLQYSLVQKVLSIESEVDVQQEPYSFRTRTVFQINRGTVTDTYELITTGKLIHVDRNFPKNTHGLLITDFFENSLQKLEDYEN
ncbi:MAG TPA: conjugal transfer protein TraK [Flavobacteriaceae bacterium]|nr:conjugal transfer protein TraK [Bacteroidota bacterium]HPF11167.1 conjugal transfer protein TraK [Flavobacteriaceae bacterium]HRW43714.1 conjugal transfer protein TraK [Flavobacteriaceae bacterium]